VNLRDSALPAALDASVAVAICSSDSRVDILHRVLPSLFKYWPDCPYSIYVCLNSKQWVAPNVTTLVASPSEWREECLAQVAQIPEEHLILVLDDFLIQRRVNQESLSTYVSITKQLDLQYLRLVPLGISPLARLLKLHQSRAVALYEAMNANRPFFSSLEIAIWNKAHFMSLLGLPGSIWDFEHQKMPGITHFAVTGSAPIVYSHLVEKGRWLPYASSLLGQAGLRSDLGTRPIRPTRMNLRLWLHR
jgi:hypothetical protein